MTDKLNLNPSLQESYHFDFRGDLELDVPVLVDPNQTVAMMDRQYLGDFITGAGMVQREGPFPDSFTEIQRIADRYPEEIFEIYGTVDGGSWAFDADLVKKAVYACGGSGGFDPEDYALYRPSGTAMEGEQILLLVSEYTPEMFVIERLFGDRDSFLQRFGAGACPSCEEEFTAAFVDCPDCYERPESVQHNIELLQEEHEGVMVAIAPLVRDLDDVDESLIRQPGEMPAPKVEVIESPGAAN